MDVLLLQKTPGGAGSAAPRHFVAPALSPGPHLPPRRRREGTLGCPPRLPDPHVRVAPDVERSISNDDETAKGVLVDSMFVEPPSERLGWRAIFAPVRSPRCVGATAD